jgi:transcriptional regulator with XRE-family HTH domain
MGATIAKRATKKVNAKRPRKKKVLTIQQMAEGIGVSTVTIDKYVKRGCPRTSVEAVQKWRAENIKAVAEDAEVSEIGIELKRAEMAERWENARTRQLKNDLASGRLIRKEDVERDVSIAISRLVNRLNSLGLKCANICPADLKAPIKEAVEDTVRTALKELCDDLRTVKN